VIEINSEGSTKPRLLSRGFVVSELLIGLSRRFVVGFNQPAVGRRDPSKASRGRGWVGRGDLETENDLERITPSRQCNPS